MKRPTLVAAASVAVLLWAAGPAIAQDAASIRIGGSVRGALIAALLVGLVDTFGKVLLPSVAGMLVYMLMAAVLLWKPEGLFKQ